MGARRQRLILDLDDTRLEVNLRLASVEVALVDLLLGRLKLLNCALFAALQVDHRF